MLPKMKAMMMMVITKNYLSSWYTSLPDFVSAYEPAESSSSAESSWLIAKKFVLRWAASCIFATSKTTTSAMDGCRMFSTASSLQTTGETLPQVGISFRSSRVGTTGKAEAQDLPSEGVYQLEFASVRRLVVVAEAMAFSELAVGVKSD